MTQEKIMKRKMIRSRWLFALTAVALLIFIGLYIDETNRVQETYRAQFITCLNNTSVSIDSYLNADGDFPLRYRQILSDLQQCQQLCFPYDGLDRTAKDIRQQDPRLPAKISTANA